mmetsp:Transcript_19272/g.32188  ORF Transcript_19272/g.32188 Transcript_19272/m.32188 type:complete len:884 (-) Transcript_19272:779-3430(-)
MHAPCEDPPESNEAQVMEPGRAGVQAGTNEMSQENGMESSSRSENDQDTIGADESCSEGDSEDGSVSRKSSHSTVDICALSEDSSSEQEEEQDEESDAKSDAGLSGTGPEDNCSVEKLTCQVGNGEDTASRAAEFSTYAIDKAKYEMECLMKQMLKDNEAHDATYFARIIELQEHAKLKNLTNVSLHRVGTVDFFNEHTDLVLDGLYETLNTKKAMIQKSFTAIESVLTQEWTTLLQSLVDLYQSRLKFVNMENARKLELARSTSAKIVKERITKNEAEMRQTKARLENECHEEKRKWVIHYTKIVTDLENALAKETTTRESLARVKVDSDMKLHRNEREMAFMKERIEQLEEELEQANSSLHGKIGNAQVFISALQRKLRMCLVRNEELSASLKVREDDVTTFSVAVERYKAQNESLTKKLLSTEQLLRALRESSVQNESVARDAEAGMEEMQKQMDTMQEKIQTLNVKLDQTYSEREQERALQQDHVRGLQFKLDQAIKSCDELESVRDQKVLELQWAESDLKEKTKHLENAEKEKEVAQIMCQQLRQLIENGNAGELDPADLKQMGIRSLPKSQNGTSTDDNLEWVQEEGGWVARKKTRRYSTKSTIKNLMKEMNSKTRARREVSAPDATSSKRSSQGGAKQNGSEPEDEKGMTADDVLALMQKLEERLRKQIERELRISIRADLNTDFEKSLSKRVRDDLELEYKIKLQDQVRQELRQLGRTSQGWEAVMDKQDKRLHQVEELLKTKDTHIRKLRKELDNNQYENEKLVLILREKDSLLCGLTSILRETRLRGQTSVPTVSNNHVKSVPALVPLTKRPKTAPLKRPTAAASLVAEIKPNLVERHFKKKVERTKSQNKPRKIVFSKQAAREALNRRKSQK